MASAPSNSLYTVVADLPDGVTVSQHAATSPARALRNALHEIESSGAVSFTDADKAVLLEMAESAGAESQLSPVDRCKNTWIWLGGTGNGQPVVVYVIHTQQ